MNWNETEAATEFGLLSTRTYSIWLDECLVELQLVFN